MLQIGGCIEYTGNISAPDAFKTCRGKVYLSLCIRGKVSVRDLGIWCRNILNIQYNHLSAAYKLFLSLC